MSATTVSPLRQRMIEDMSLRNLAPRTQEAYTRGCKKLAAFLGRSPDTATGEDIRRFQLHLAERGVSICTRNRTMTGVAFLFRVTLRRPEIADQIEYIAEPQKIPPESRTPEIGTSGSMSGDGKRGVGHWPQATAPIFDSTLADLAARVRCGAEFPWRRMR
jgi:Phage integrase, N-terminal SAM-like domain